MKRRSTDLRARDFLFGSSGRALLRRRARTFNCLHPIRASDEDSRVDRARQEARASLTRVSAYFFPRVTAAGAHGADERRGLGAHWGEGAGAAAEPGGARAPTPAVTSRSPTPLPIPRAGVRRAVVL